MILGLVAPVVSISVAQAHSAPVSRTRLAIRMVSADIADPTRFIPVYVPPAATPAQAPVAAPPPPPAAVPVVTARPKPVVIAPPRIPYNRQAIADLIRAAAARHGVDPNQMLRVAMCESGLNPNAYNPSGATGLFQFKPATFYGHGGHNIYDPADQSEIAARMFAAGLSYEWSCR
ncbi:MAG: transglycosylase SLT domain-containing protein [Candidatus Dormibacteria bacterium]